MPRRNRNSGEQKNAERTDFSYLIAKPNTDNKGNKPLNKYNNSTQKGRIFINESKKGR